jgi:hypothetical protein
MRDRQHNGVCPFGIANRESSIGRGFARCGINSSQARATESFTAAMEAAFS